MGDINRATMGFGTGGKLKRCKDCYKQKCECGGASAARAPAPAARSRAESQSALDADIAMIETTPRSNKAPRAKNNKARYTDPGADNIPGNPNACNPDREPTDSGFAQNDRVVHGTRGVGTVLGFFGEFVCVQYDIGPVGQHKYTWPKARKVLDFSSKAGGPPDEAPPPAENVSCAAPSGSMKVITAANGVEICADCMARVALCKCSFSTEKALPAKKLKKPVEREVEREEEVVEITCTKKAPAPLPVARRCSDAKPIAGRCEECFRKVCICDKEEPSPSPIRAKPASKASAKAPESYNQNGSDILGIGGGNDDDEEMEREETDSGFAQWDRVKHTKRGLGRCIGFFGEFVMIQFDDEPQGRHKYTWDQANRKVSIVGWEPPNKQA